MTSDEAEILLIPAAELRRVLAEMPAVSKTIVDALIMRRRRLRRDREFAGMRVLAAATRAMDINSTIFWTRTTSHIV